jgi:DNA-binding NarL/FixJ family response regulator
VRVVIADDHRLFRQGLRSLLGTVADVEVVGDAADGQEALRVERELAPDLVLMDLHMPGGGGLEATRTIARDHPGVNVLVLTMFADDDSVFASLRAGARGYVLKDADDDELVRAIRTVGKGGAIYSPGVAARMSKFFASLAAGVTRDPALAALTDSEHRVLAEMARGLSNDAIATKLGYSPKTVRNYVSIIFTKLHVADRAQAIVFARGRGLG